MEEDITGKWDNFEARIRATIEGDFRWKIRPRDTASNRQMVADLVKDAIERDNGTFPASNTFIERLDE